MGGNHISKLTLIYLLPSSPQSLSFIRGPVISFIANIPCSEWYVLTLISFSLEQFFSLHYFWRWCVGYFVVSQFEFIVVRIRVYIFERNITEVMLCSYCIVSVDTLFCLVSLLMTITVITWVRWCQAASSLKVMTVF